MCIIYSRPPYPQFLHICRFNQPKTTVVFTIEEYACINGLVQFRLTLFKDHPHTMKHHPTFKNNRKGNSVIATAWMNLKGIMLNEMNQTEKDNILSWSKSQFRFFHILWQNPNKYFANPISAHCHLFMWNLKKIKIQTHRNRAQWWLPRVEGGGNREGLITMYKV